MIAACDFWRMTTRSPETLEAKVERLVREHLAEQQMAVKAALERAFTVATKPRVIQRNKAAYRPRSELADLAEQLFEAVKACPGETMTVLAARVGGKPPALHRPMRHLKQSGRVRSALLKPVLLR